ncbi:TIGR03899 family protein [Paraglaciecola sp.]|uniref:TIGR03899 family protein n=1 Tax=Paraglaciecola sp. TaxID=1920173 RepID=UPI0030F3D3A0
MKIQSSISNNAIVEVQSKTSGPEKVIAKSIKQSEKSTKFAGKDRVEKWFAQAGVYPNYAKRPSQSLDEKIFAKNILKERRKFSNLERILGKALNFCLEETQSDDLDPDWFFSFVNMAEDVYSAQMQEVWGKIFAVESSQPGSFSLNTLQTLKQLTQKDALIFRQAVNLASKRKGESVPKILLGYYRKKSIWSFFKSRSEHQLNLAHFSLSYPDLLALMNLGLIHHSEIETGELDNNQITEWRIAGHSVNFMPKHRGLTLVYFKFTTTGAELSKLINSQKQDAYVTALKQTLVQAFDIS